MTKLTNEEKKAALKKISVTHPIDFLSLGFGSGLISPAPGTWGTLAGLLTGVGLLYLTSPLTLFIISIIAFLLGCYFCDATAKRMGVHDHGAIVWDEIAAMWLIMVFLPTFNIAWCVVAFLLFRLFDISKPWPISSLDRRVKGGIGIMIDDTVAAIYAIVVMRVIYIFFI